MSSLACTSSNIFDFTMYNRPSYCNQFVSVICWFWHSFLLEFWLVFQIMILKLIFCLTIIFFCSIESNNFNQVLGSSEFGFVIILCPCDEVTQIAKMDQMNFFLIKLYLKSHESIDGRKCRYSGRTCFQLFVGHLLVQFASCIVFSALASHVL